ncbi:MAG: TOBE domain-containing protein [Hydrogenothermaceae bacterium]|nr:TOBE domain-containing protein [Hydrogenothermaceae bacterium]
MNRVKGKVSRLLEDGNFSLLQLETEVGELHLLLIKSHNDFIQEGKCVSALFGHASVKIFKEMSLASSLENIIRCRVESISRGKILSTVRLSCKDGKVESYLTNISLEKIKIQEDQEVYIAISAFDIMIEV